MPENWLPVSARIFRVIFLVGAALLLPYAGALRAQTAAKKTSGGPGSAEQRAERAFEAARANPLNLRAFLVRMPKGADLHYHLTGGIYAESFIRAAAQDGLCVDLASLSFTKPADRTPIRCPPTRVR